MPGIGRVVGLQDLSLDIITSILRFLTPEEVLCARLISRYLDSVVLDNIRYVIPYADVTRLNDSLISKILYRRVPCAGEDVSGSNAVRLVTQLAYLASKIDRTTKDVEHHRKTICDALTVSKGREWVLDNLGHPAVDSCNGDYTMVLAAWLGLEDVVKACLADGSPANQQLEHLGSGLYAAAFNNSASLARLLIYHGADVWRKECYYGDALQLAAYRGSEAALRILVGESMSTFHNSESHGFLEEYEPFGSPLGAAAAAGHKTSTRNLLTWRTMLCDEEDYAPEVPFFLAVKNGRASVVRLLLDFKLFDPRNSDADGNTPLMVAITHNQVSIVRVLLEYDDTTGGYDLLGDDGVSVPVMMAAERGLVRILELLLNSDSFDDNYWQESLLPVIAERHTNVMESLAECRSFREESSVRFRAELLHWALCEGNARIAQLLCEVQDESLYRRYEYIYGDNVLHTAAYLNRPEVITALLERDETDPNVVNSVNYGKTPLMIAARNNNVECIGALLRDSRTNRDETDDDGLTALMHAISRGCSHSLQLFQSCDPNVTDDMDRTALEVAMVSGNSSAVDYLLSREDLDLKMAFDLALARKNLEVAESVLARDDFDPNANSSLHSAIEHYTVAVGLILARGDINPNMISSGRTPLHLAIENDEIEVAKILLAREDVDPNSVVDEQATPLDVAIMQENKQAVKALLTRGDIDINRGKCPPLMRALWLLQHKIASLLLSDDRIDIHQQDEEGNTALIEVASSGNMIMLRQLFSKDGTLDVNQRVRRGDTALLKAAGCGHEIAVQYLIDMGADANARNDYNQTPLHAAAYNGHDGVVKLLINNGADPNIVDKDGNTPYVAAIRAVKLLRNNNLCLTPSEKMGPLWQLYA